MTSTGRHTATERKDEVGEARAQLKDPTLDSDPAKKRVVLQRVIALMTMGVDVSSLFPEVILACFTPDLVSKKLIYFFLTTHSEKNPELAILSINTFLKECSDASPSVRGLALRSLASLKGVSQLYDYLLPMLQRGLGDRAAYVRRIAVLCTLTVFRDAPQEFIASDFYEKILGMLRDTDPQVCANALEVLLEIADYDKRLEEEAERRLEAERSNGEEVTSSSPRDSRKRQEAVTDEYSPAQHTPFLVTKAVLYHLLNHLSGLNEWQQTQIIDLVQHYTPTTEDEMFDIMNVLEDRLTGMHSGLALSCCHAFIHLTQNHPAVHAQVLERIRQPLLMLLTCSPSVESAYAVLCHLKLLVKRSPDIYRESYRHFYCHRNEPSYVKVAKIDVLAIVADASSAGPIVEELVAVSEDRNLIIAQRAVEALGSIALRLPVVAKTVLDYFLEFISLGIQRTRGPTLVVMTRFLRRYRDISMVRPFVAAVLEAHNASPFRDEDSRVSLVWLLGEFGEHIDEAPYLLDTLCDDLLSESAAFRLQVLTSAVTLFFKRPPEMQMLLGKIFDVLVNDFSNADVLDRAMMYYRLLKESPTTAAHVICTPKRPITSFLEDQDTNIVDKLFFEDFDSLAVVYGVTADRFTSQGGILDESDDSDCDEDNDGDNEYEAGADGHGGMAMPSLPSHEQQLSLLDNKQGPGEDHAGNLLAKILSLHPGDSSSTSSPPPPNADGNPYVAPSVNPSVRTAASSPPATQPLALAEDVDMEPSDFQREWGEAPIQATFTTQLARFPGAGALEDFLEDRLVFTLASGDQEGSMKLYLFGRTMDAGVDALFGEASSDTALFLVELIITRDGVGRATVKSHSPCGKSFAGVLQGMLQQFR